MSNPIDVTTWTIGDCVEQLEFCGYECEAGTLKNNVAYKRILAIHDEQAARIAELEELVRDVAAIIGAGADTSSGGYWIDGDEREATVIDRRPGAVR